MRLLTELAAEHGLDAARALAGTGVREQQLRNPEATVTGEQELRLIDNLVTHLDHVPALGVKAGQRYHFTAFGALGFALVSSKTGHDALDIGLKHIRLTFAFCRFSQKDRGGFIHVTLDDSDLPQRLRRFIVERDSACLLTLQRDLFSGHSLLEAMRFAFADPGYVGDHEAVYGVTPRYAAKTNEAVIDRVRMMRHLPQANERARAAQQQCESLLNQRRQRGGLSAKVRNYLAAHAADMPAMTTVARAHHMTLRTLRRRLLQEDASFAELRDEVRQTLAEEYLVRAGLSVEQVAERLGYAEATSFINAYQRWHGTTPAVRRQQAGTARTTKS